MTQQDEMLASLVREMIREQRSRRRFKYVMWLGALALISTTLVVDHFSAEGGGENGITARVDVNGPIADGEAANAESLKKSITQAFEDSRTKAVVLKINSPGGSPVQAGYVYDEIKRQRGLHTDIKVYAVITDLGASGAYYIASAADEIYADKASLVGSIGVTAASFGYVGVMEKLGIERRAYTSGEHKAFLDPFQPRNAEETAFWNGVLKTTHDQFIGAVKAGRGERLKTEGHPDLFSGLIWSGEQALQLGLVDKLGDIDYVAREVVGATKVVDFSTKDNPFDRFAKRIGTSVAQELSMTLGFAGQTLR
ncbi:putative peptidase [Pseudomonas veronii]|uniref:signal peptide peptidase SppA n=1 Tax=Pseudomonas veronii TaxID=76761 RepID=UPI0017513CE5|nr:signal peptide peptidase SppA [Pseudomonas veronii]CAD0264222.1 putative peptidase [Pseudomonas veronii]